jgi:hypothetical protein
LRRRRPAAASDPKRQHEVSVIPQKTEDSNITMQFLHDTITSVAGSSDLAVQPPQETKITSQFPDDTIPSQFPAAGSSDPKVHPEDSIPLVSQFPDAHPADIISMYEKVDQD